MTFEIPKETNAGKVVEVEIGATPEKGGTRAHTVTIGGSTALPFHFFEGKHPHRPMVAMEVFDKAPAKHFDSLMEHFGDVIAMDDSALPLFSEQEAEQALATRALLLGEHRAKADARADKKGPATRKRGRKSKAQ